MHRCSCAVTHPNSNVSTATHFWVIIGDMQIHKREQPRTAAEFRAFPPARNWSRLATLLLLAGLSMWVALAPQPAAAQGPVRSPGAVLAEPLRRELEEANGPVSFLVILDEQLTPPGLVAQAQAAPQPAGTARAAIYQALTAHAARTQAPLRAWLDAQQRDVPVLLSGQHAGSGRRPGPGRGTACPPGGRPAGAQPGHGADPSGHCNRPAPLGPIRRASRGDDRSPALWPHLHPCGPGVGAGSIRARAWSSAARIPAWTGITWR